MSDYTDDYSKDQRWCITDAPPYQPVRFVNVA
jgi:hypothetical protein